MSDKKVHANLLYIADLIFYRPALSKYDCLTSRGHASDKLLKLIRLSRVIPCFFHYSSKFIVGSLPSPFQSWVMVLYVIFHTIPYVLNWIQVGRIRSPVERNNEPLPEPFDCSRCAVWRSIVPHHRNLWSHGQHSINQRYNSLRVWFWGNRPPFLLPEKARTFLYPCETSPKHPAKTLSQLFHYTGGVDFFTYLELRVRSVFFSSWGTKIPAFRVTKSLLCWSSVAQVSSVQRIAIQSSTVQSLLASAHSRRFLLTSPERGDFFSARWRL